MKVNILIGKEARTIDLPEGSTSEDALRSLGLLADAHLILRGKTPLPIDERLSEGESIKIVKVASGG